jgi:hypothetical protein
VLLLLERSRKAGLARAASLGDIIRFTPDELTELDAASLDIEPRGQHLLDAKGLAPAPPHCVARRE